MYKNIEQCVNISWIFQTQSKGANKIRLGGSSSQGSTESSSASGLSRGLTVFIIHKLVGRNFDILILF